MGQIRMLRLKTVVTVIVLSFFSLCFSAPAGAQDAKPFPYEKDLLRFEKEDQATPPTNETTFFVGSSTFTIWKEIPEDFAEFHAVNRGFGGSQISQWLEVAADRVLVPHAPNRIVFFCGCNDIAGGKTPEKTLEDFKAFVMKMRASNPKVIIHFCALHMPPVRIIDQCVCRRQKISSKPYDRPPIANRQKELLRECFIAKSPVY